MGVLDATGAKPSLPAGLPDDWLLDRDLPCPSCQYNLRMLSTPRCPECGTVFRWQSILHVSCPRCAESLEVVDADTCPRCRLELDWERLFGQADPARFKQFEYAQRPVRAAVWTWFAALRPRRFWQDIRLETPPATRRLRWLLAAAIGTYVLAIAVAHWSNRAFWPDARFGPEWWAFCAGTLIVPIVTIVGLPLFVPTLARFRIRHDQLLRCLAFGCSGLTWIGWAFLLAVPVMIVLNLLWPVVLTVGGATAQNPRLLILPGILLTCLEDPWMWRWYGVAACLDGVLLALTLYFSSAWWWLFLWTALHQYLRLNRRNAVALFVSTQLIGLIGFAIILVRYTQLGMIVGALLNRMAS